MGEELALGLGVPKKSVSRNVLFFKPNFLNDLFRPKFLFFQTKFLMTFFSHIIDRWNVIGRIWTFLTLSSYQVFQRNIGGRKHGPSPTSNFEGLSPAAPKSPLMNSIACRYRPC